MQKASPEENANTRNSKIAKEHHQPMGSAFWRGGSRPSMSERATRQTQRATPERSLWMKPGTPLSSFLIPQLSFVAKRVILLLAALTLAAVGCQSRRAAPSTTPPDPFGPIRSISDIRQNAATLTGQMVRLRGRITGLRNLNPGMPFPWDVVYTVDDGTGTLPIRWFTHEQAPKDPKPPILPDGQVIVTGRVKQALELEGKIYLLLIHEETALHNQERPTLPAAPGQS
jgi:hypothetical protein